MKPLHEVADVLRINKDRLNDIVNNSWKERTLHALHKCRTAALGGHIDRCDNPECGHLHLSYNSCRNRHCPKCQGHKREEWMQARESELLNVPYFHVVFTLPQELNELCLQKPALVYGLLFKTAWAVIRNFGENEKFLAAKMGMIAILHTWACLAGRQGQNLSLHPHLHCIVPGGGLTKNGKWKPAKGKGKYLFPVKSISKVFRARFVELLRKESIGLEQAFYDSLFAKDWVVYCKRPFFGPKQVVEYLGRYTHKIAISNHRIKEVTDGNVTFSAKDYRKGGKKHNITLSQEEFIRRFALHVLPKGFVRIRHCGILSSTLKKVCLQIIREQTGNPEIEPKPMGTILHRCPLCKKGTLITLLLFDQRGPPAEYIRKLTNKTLAKK